MARACKHHQTEPLPDAQLNRPRLGSRHCRDFPSNRGKLSRATGAVAPAMLLQAESPAHATPLQSHRATTSRATVMEMIPPPSSKCSRTPSLSPQTFKVVDTISSLMSRLRHHRTILPATASDPLRHVVPLLETSFFSTVHTLSDLSCSAYICEHAQSRLRGQDWDH